MELNWTINLQLFSGEKTESATPRKRQETRKKGQVAKSPEISSAVVMLTAFMALRFIGPLIYHQMLDFMKSSLIMIADNRLSVASINNLVINLVIFFLQVSLPLMLILMVIGVAANIAQVGFLFTGEPLIPKLEKIDPIKGFQKIFSKRALVELAKSIFKILVIAYVSYATIKGHINELLFLMKMSPPEIVELIAGLTYDLGVRISFALLIIAFADYAYQKWEYEENIKMSKQEIKEEHKMIEGNPQIKSKIREKQRQIAMRRMMQSVPNADVVITNPTHYAIALKYDATKATAPYVIAKGEGHVALKIKEIAKENKIITVENKPLAQALYKSVDINQEIPPELYQAVAEVLAFVYKLKRKI